MGWNPACRVSYVIELSHVTHLAPWTRTGSGSDYLKELEAIWGKRRSSATSVGSCNGTSAPPCDASSCRIDRQALCNLNVRRKLIPAELLINRSDPAGNTGSRPFAPLYDFRVIFVRSSALSSGCAHPLEARLWLFRRGSECQAYGGIPRLELHEAQTNPFLRAAYMQAKS